MMKKGLVTLVCLVVMSAMCAWASTTVYLQTKTTNLGGSITVKKGAVVKSTTSGTGAIKYTAFLTTDSGSYSVDADSGYKIAALKVNGVDVPAAVGQTTYPDATDPGFTGAGVKSVVATFSAATSGSLKSWQLQVKNSAGGDIETTRNSATVSADYPIGKLVLKNFSDTAPVAVKVTPKTGYHIDSIVFNGKKLAGVPATGAYTVPVDPSATGKVFSVSVAYKQDALTVTGTTGVLPGSVITRFGGSVTMMVIPPGTNNVVKSLTVTDGASYTATDNAGNTRTPFTGTVKVVLTNITKNIEVSAEYGYNPKNDIYQACSASCHNNASLPSVAAVYGQWDASKHSTANYPASATGVVDCVTCHKAMPGPDYSTTAAKEALCATCHAPGASANHPAVEGNQSHCSACHTFSGGHNPVKTNVTGTITSTCAECHTAHDGGNAFLKAQYVSAASLPVSCADCHSDNTTANQAILAQFAESAHGATSGEAWIHYDWRTGNRSSCARCHTGTAFVAKLGSENNTSNVFLPGDVLKPGEALACSACHTDAGTGELRVAAPEFTINMSNGATVTYEVAGASTLCARCHGGRETGESIKADSDTTGVRGFIDSHYQPAAGTVYNKAGYEYPGHSYDSLGSHKLLGATSQGPCVTCHMAGNSHTFVAASCGLCHGVTAPDVDAWNLKATYDAALNNLKLALEAKGIHYGPVHPFFFTAPYVAGGTNTPFTNWAGVYGAARWKDTMGAAFNYNLLRSEKGAYAHNYRYAMKLIADSIDFLTDGSVDGP